MDVNDAMDMENPCQESVTTNCISCEGSVAEDSAVMKVFQASTANDSGKVLLCCKSEWTPKGYLPLAERHTARARNLHASHAKLLEEAARETATEGRP